MPKKRLALSKFRLTAHPDVPDFRDWTYQPALIPLLGEMKPPRNLKILDQGTEGSCTGFGLAAAINQLRKRAGLELNISPRMLYEMAKRHDQWPGFKEEGSSCRGAIRGWYNMGVCEDGLWPYVDQKPGQLTLAAAENARENTIGAYYRLGTRISDFHAALNEAGVVYCSADIHEGWERADKKSGAIPFSRRGIGGHAFALVGYDEEGFWVQNSWGTGWGRRGLGLWLYEDWQANIADAWVMRLALSTPQIWHLPSKGGSDAGRTEGLIRKTPNRAEIAGHFVHIDDGKFHDHGKYWSDAADVNITAELVADRDKYKHLLFYAHGGLNGVKDSARRVSAMKETFKKNGIYPYHFMYDTGMLEEINDILWGRKEELSHIAAGLGDAWDRRIERVTHRAGRAIWRETKKGASKPFGHSGAGLSVLTQFLDANSAAENPKKIHLAGHSTGGILLAYLLAALANMDRSIRISSVSLMAPAGTIELFRETYLPLLKAPRSQTGINKMDVYNLTDKLELDDNVAAVYNKSLLYLVSRSFEEDERPRALLGMQKYSRELRNMPRNLTFHYSGGDTSICKKTLSKSHGGFDNDPVTMNRLLQRILGKKGKPEFSKRVLRY